ncbi:ASCH domain-containing protein [Peptococcus niger]|uniref:Predicted transcriptional regulator, contains an HTH and PUA-like domains n=1 Tax=Peptococcus niger TaxID=2741 RepID=A0A1G6W2R1_PEPNI|nr:ASCH domain-containing protein [Peptococcus niger]SDD60230.1 Predicted transcriptional regulator, contains an HTH and PUA-like domains [Peptococcus niger]
MSTMLLSIKPKYANVILQGKKEYEFRKKRCRDGVTKIVFYSSSPQKQVVGEAEIKEIIEGSPTKIWEIAKHAAGITRKAFYDYYRGRHTAVAYKLKNVVVYEEPKELSDYGISHAPQSYVYLD